MPIEFACACGKQFKVADEYAGKRSKCTACGQPVVVPTPPPPAAVEESAEDAAMRALLEDSEPEPSNGGRVTGRAEPPAPRPMSPPAAAFKPPTTARKDSPPTYRSNPDTPAKKNPAPNWVKVGSGIAMAAVGVVVLVGALAVYFGGGSVQRWAFIIPGPLILASPFFIIDGFRDRSKK